MTDFSKLSRREFISISGKTGFATLVASVVGVNLGWCRLPKRFESNRICECPSGTPAVKVAYWRSGAWSCTAMLPPAQRHRVMANSFGFCGWCQAKASLMRRRRAKRPPCFNKLHIQPDKTGHWRPINFLA